MPFPVTRDAAWPRVDALIATRLPGEYDTAVALLADLKALADRGAAFAKRSTALRRTHSRKTSLISRLDQAKI